MSDEQTTRRYTRRPLAERTWEKVDKTDGGCWLWTGSRSPGGYGQIRDGGKFGKLWTAHRLIWEWENGPIPEGLQLDHLCRVRHCVNPAHLEPVTQSENLRRGLSGALRKTCNNGHPWVPENMAPNGPAKTCRLCKQERERNR